MCSYFYYLCQIQLVLEVFQGKDEGPARTKSRLVTPRNALRHSDRLLQHDLSLNSSLRVGYISYSF